MKKGTQLFAANPMKRPSVGPGEGLSFSKCSRVLAIKIGDDWSAGVRMALPDGQMPSTDHLRALSMNLIDSPTTAIVLVFGFTFSLTAFLGTIPANRSKSRLSGPIHCAQFLPARSPPDESSEIIFDRPSRSETKSFSDEFGAPDFS